MSQPSKNNAWGKTSMVKNCSVNEFWTGETIVGREKVINTLSYLPIKQTCRGLYAPVDTKEHSATTRDNHGSYN